MFDFLKKYLSFILALFFIIATVVFFEKSHDPNFTKEAKQFEANFRTQVQRLEHNLERAVELYNSTGVEGLWNDRQGAADIAIHLYQRDSLKYWSTNQIPILRYADIHFPSEGMNHLQNGWYFTKIERLDKVLIASTILIRSDYTYENEDLVNGFAPAFNWLSNTEIGVDPTEGLAINDEKGDYLFSLIPNSEPVVDQFYSIGILVGLLGAIFFLILGLNSVFSSLRIGYVILPLLLFGLRIVSIKYEWTTYLADGYSFSPTLYGGSVFVQNIADYLLNLMIIAFGIYWLIELVRWIGKKKHSNAIFVFMLFSALPLWSLILWLIKDLISNSQIPISLNEVFTLNIYSLIVLLGWGVLLLLYYRFIQLVMSKLVVDRNSARIVFLIFILGFGFFIWSVLFAQYAIAEGLLPLLGMLSVYFLGFRSQERNPLGAGLIQLFLFSLILSITLGVYNQQREREERKLYADQLAWDKDFEAEWEYSKISNKLREDKILSKIINGEAQVGKSDFQEIMERRYFNGFWERYDIDCALLEADGTSLFDSVSTVNEIESLDRLISKVGEYSALDSGMVYLTNYSSSFNYVIREKLGNKDSLAYLVCTLRSKKIPEEIGFPRLLISGDANVLEPLENYSIAKYNNGKLISQHGDFGFPSRASILRGNLASKSFFVSEGYEHYYLQRNSDDEIILSIKRSGFYDQLTAFSYLFSLYGLILLPILFRSRRKHTREVMSLAMRIQLMLIFIVFIALLGFGFGSGFFIREQYNEYTNNLISDKLSSVEIEVQNHLGNYDRLSTADNRDMLQHILQEFAEVFNTDINMYDKDGYLLATSKPKLFNMGIVSEQINPEAFRNLTIGSKSKYVHQENIGRLDYASAYRPFYNQSGKHLAYINLQHFGKQSELESQIQGLLVAIINIFILLLALTVLLALMVSNWLTIPLRKLQESMSNVRFGKHNDPIPYGGTDEIGSLVKAYNQKLEELAFTAEQLAQSERESAWREMAKQVAHEIKNPLTPMKLSVQQLLRSFDPEDPNSRQKLERVANSIVEQIDALTSIANEFSNFAKLPQLKASPVDMFELTQNVLTIFEGEYSCDFTLESDAKRTIVNGDREQLLRVLNNLIKNAVQAIPADRKGSIAITMKEEAGLLIITVKDNGVGISFEERKNLFVPYFTTKSTGTGLGLAMVKQIIENHRGTIHVTSEKGEGAAFIIELPLDN